VSVCSIPSGGCIRLRCLLARACQRLWLFGGYGACGGSPMLDLSFSLTSHRLDAGSGKEHLAAFSLSNRQRRIVSTAFDPAVTSHADVDRLLRTEPQVQLTPFVLNNHSNSFKSHGGLLPSAGRVRVTSPPTLYVANQGRAKEIIRAAIADMQLGLGRQGHSVFYAEAIVGAHNMASRRVAEQVISDTQEEIVDGISDLPALRYVLKVETPINE